MDVDAFETWLRERDRSDVEWLITAVAATSDTTDAEIERRRALREVARVLQRSGRRRQACEAQHRLRLCMLGVCAETGVRDRNMTGTTRVARAAGDAARALVAGDDVPATALLIRPFLESVSRPVS